MPGSRLFSLAQLIWLSYAPPQIVALAAQTGYDCAGLRLLPASPNGMAYPLMNEPKMLRETLSVMHDTGIKIFDLEIIRIGPTFNTEEFKGFFEVGQRLDAKAILVAGDDPDEARLTASFARLCEAARPFGLTCDLEFMPWTKVPDGKSALRIVQAADQPNGGVLVDAIHFGRSETTLGDIASIPRNRLHYAQICDAPGPTPTTTDGLIYTARSERLLPGEGVVDIGGLFITLPADLPVSVEIPTESRAHLGPEKWARECLAATKRSLGVR
jgi:sugar phosphate isomerase/epimerase